MELPKSASDKSPIDDKGARNYAGARIMNPFPGVMLLTPAEAVQTINILSGLLLADERFKQIKPEDFKRYGVGQ
jgi:hypothetical protein